MKKLVLVLLVLCMAAGLVTAQAKNAVTIDLAPLARGLITIYNDSEGPIIDKGFGIGAAAEYERLLSNKFAIGARFDFLLFRETSGITNFETKKTDTYLLFTALGRFYPLSDSLEKLYIGVGLGFDLGIYKWKEDWSGGLSSSDTEFSIALMADIGWKQPITDFLFVSAGLSYRISKFTFNQIAGDFPLINVGIGFKF